MSILQMSLSASAIILFTVILRRLALNRLPKRTFVALWLLAAARMLLPWKLPFRFSAGTILSHTAEPALRSAMPVISNAVQQTFVPAVEATTPAMEIPVWRIIWIVGLLACALALTLPHLRWRRVYARSLPAADAKIAGWLQGQKIFRHVRVRTSDEIPSPLTCGLLRPMILLPANLKDFGGMEYVLAHEMTHIRHMDALWKLVLAAALCAHWFNPMAWAMYLLANRDIELVCDETVLACIGEGARREYAHALIDLAARQSGLPSPLFSGFSRQTIEERIRAIMKMKRLTKIAVIAAVLLVAFSTLAFATTAESAPETEDPRTAIGEMMFDGWEDMSVLEYRAWLVGLGIDLDSLFHHKENVWYEIRYDDFLYYVLEPLTSENFMVHGIWTRDGSLGGRNLDTGEEATMNYRVTCKVLDPDRLTVGRLHDSLKMVWQGINLLDPLGSTQAELQERAVKLAEEGSDGETIAFEIEVELAGQQSPYSDHETEALLKQYVDLGLEYDYTLGKLTMSFEGREVDGIWDETTGRIIANSTGPEGLGGGNILEVIYEDGKPVELRFIEG